MAVETVRLMEERGVPVTQLYLIAPMPLDFYRVGPFHLQIGGLRQPVAELRFRQVLRLFWRHNNPLTQRPYQRAWHLAAIQPWRHLLCLVGRLRRRVGLPLTPRILHADVRLERFRLHRQYGRIPDVPVTRSHPPASWPSAANSSICRTYRKTAGEESRRRSPVANRWMRP